MRERIAQVVERAEKGDKLSAVYDFFISITAIVSLIPLMFKETNPTLDFLDTITVYILFLDYILRWMSYDFLSKIWNRERKALVLYPVTPLAICDLLSLLPSLGLLGHGFRMLRLLRLLKLCHYSKSFSRVMHAFTKERKVLGSVLIIAVAYIFISALVMFAYEPDTFGNFFDALYWATTALTTVGYGDVYPKTDIGQLISMVSSLFGIAVIAMPAGIITSSFLEEINRDREAKAAEGEETSITERIMKIREERLRRKGVIADEDDE